MSTRAFVVSDTHFGHKLMGVGIEPDGEKIRPFASVEEHDETIVERWNAVVKPQDRVYHLGDVAINRRAVATLGRCNGRIALIKGNHDIFKLKDYLPYVDDIRAYRVFTDTPVMMVLSHIPIHAESMGRFGMNAHGHTHKRILEDRRYRNVCLEQTGYAPIRLDQLIEEAKHIT